MAAEIPDGAFIVARALFNSSLWTMRKDDKILAVTLIGLANWKDKKWFDGTRDITIKRGQLVRGIRKLAREAGLSYQECRTSIKHLENVGFLTQEPTQGPYTLITLPKYDKYQDLTKYADSEFPGQLTQNPTSSQREPNAALTRAQREPNDKQESYKGNEGEKRKERREVCAEPSRTTLPAGELPKALKDLPLYAADPKLVGQYPALVMTWRAAYPGINVEAEIAKAHAWETANPAQRKVNRSRFLNSWLARAQDRPKPLNGTHETYARSDGTGRLKCVSCGGSKTIAGDVVDGKIILSPCPRCHHA